MVAFVHFCNLQNYHLSHLVFFFFLTKHHLLWCKHCHFFVSVLTHTFSLFLLRLSLYNISISWGTKKSYMCSKSALKWICHIFLSWYACSWSLVFIIIVVERQRYWLECPILPHVVQVLIFKPDQSKSWICHHEIDNNTSSFSFIVDVNILFQCLLPEEIPDATPDNLQASNYCN